MKKKLTVEDEVVLIDYWLNKAYNLNLMDIPEWVRTDPEFFRKYSVSEELHDEWYKWALDYCGKKTGLKGAMLKQSFSWLYLNVAPCVKFNENKDND